MNTHRLTGNLKAEAGARFFAMLVIILSASLFAHAQQITGTLVGTVQDESGAVVPHAKITVTSIDTGQVHATESNGVGEYRVEYLAVGNYQIGVEAQGFKKFLQKSVVILVDQTETVNVNLAIGEQSQTITVSEAPPLVNTTTAEIGRTVEAEEITALPLPNRNPYTQLSLTPGVLSSSATGGGGNPSASGAGYNQVVGLPSTQVVINGGFDGGVGSVSFYLDGGINMTGIRNYGNPSPNPDALQEFRVETNNYAAQYGRFGAGVVTLVTRSGTNKFHGSLFEFDRNTILNDTPWGAPTNPLTGKLLNAPYHRNQFGGSFGGPIKSNKTFFFFSGAALRQITDSLETGAIVPTALERLGDFTQSPVVPDNPGTKTAVKSTNTSSNCATATTGCMSPSAFDTTALAILNAYIPTGNQAHNVTIAKGLPGAGSVVSETNGWAGYFPSPYNNSEYLAKVDHQFSNSNRLAVSYFTVKSLTTVSGGGNVLWSAQTDQARQDNVNISDTQVMKSGLINQSWFTYTRNFGGRSNAAMPPINGSGFTNLASFGSDYTIQGTPALPQITTTGYFTLGQSIQGPTAGSNFYSLRDVASKSIGKHSLDFGAEMSLDKDVQITDLDNYGVFSFATSAPKTTGNVLADFLTGNPATMEQDTPDEAITNSWYYAFFVQDSYRIIPRLTLNLGLRYDFQTPPTDNSQNRESTFVPGSASTVIPTAPAGMLFAGDSGVSKGTVSMKFHHISPRLGLAYDPFGDGKTSIRAAAGIFYGGVSGNEWNATSNFAPYALRQTFANITSLTNIYGNASSFPNGDPFPYNYSAKSPLFPADSNEEGASLKFQWPYTYQFNASVQRQLPGNASVTVAYVGAFSHDLPFQRDMNYDEWANGATTSAANENSRHPYDNETATCTSSCSLNEVQILDSEVTASYNSLQVSASKRLSRNFSMSGFYVYGKAFQSASPGGATIGTIPQDFSTMTGERAVTAFDQTHTANMSGIWDSSYYHGPNRFIGGIVNGWQISPIVTLNSGIPINVLSGANNNDDEYGNNRPNYVAGIKPTLSPHRPRAQEAAQWFNPAAFVGNACQVGNLPVATCLTPVGVGTGPGGADGDVPFNALRAPGYRDIDLGIFRSVAVWRESKLQFRAEATNAFNLVSLASPGASGPVSAAGKAASATFGVITAAQGVPRQIQLGARLTF